MSRLRALREKGAHLLKNLAIATLRKLKGLCRDVVEAILLTIATLGLLVVVIQPYGVQLIAATALVYGYIVSAIKTGAHLLSSMDPRLSKLRWPWLEKRPQGMQKLIAVITAPLYIPAGCLLASYAWILTESQKNRRCFRAIHWFLVAQISRPKALAWVHPWMVVQAVLFIAGFWLRAIWIVQFATIPMFALAAIAIGCWKYRHIMALMKEELKNAESDSHS